MREPKKQRVIFPRDWTPEQIAEAMEGMIKGEDAQGSNDNPLTEKNIQPTQPEETETPEA